MPLSPTGSGFSGNPGLFNTGNDFNRVPANRVLVPYSERHEGTSRKHVSRPEMDALLAANRAISDTWRILNSGSGNQEKHLISTEGDSFKRTALAQTQANQSGMGFGADRARTAARFQAGNCGEMAAVCALLGSSSGIHQPVSVLHSTGFDHCVAEFGDRRVTSNTVIADPWPEFSRALRRKDCTLLDPNPLVLSTFQPIPAPHERNRLLYDNKVSQEQIDRDFAKQFPAYPKGGKKLVRTIMSEQRVYSQVHGADHLGRYYKGEDSQGNAHVVDLNLTEYEFKQRLVQLGIDPIDGRVIPGNRRPQTSWIGNLKLTLGMGRARSESISAAPPEIAVPWTPPVRTPAADYRWGPEPPRNLPLPTAAPVIPPAASRHRPATAAEPARASRSERRRGPSVDVPRRAVEDTRVPRENRRRAPSADPRSRQPMADVERPRTHRNASRDGHRHAMDTPARRERANSFAVNRYRFPDPYAGA